MASSKGNRGILILKGFLCVTAFCVLDERYQPYLHVNSGVSGDFQVFVLGREKRVTGDLMVLSSKTGNTKEEEQV